LQVIVFFLFVNSPTVNAGGGFAEGGGGIHRISKRL